MAGRPRREPTDTQRQDIHRLARKYGANPIAARLQLPVRVVRRELAEARIRQRAMPPWAAHEDAFLRAYAGERGKARLARELMALGVLLRRIARGEPKGALEHFCAELRELGLVDKGMNLTPEGRAAVVGEVSARSERQVACRVRILMGLGLRELRLELTIAQVAQLIGRSDEWVVQAIAHKRLKAHKSDGAWRVVPSALRNYVLDDKGRVDWQRCEVDELADLLARRWGVSDEERRKGKEVQA